MDCKKDIKGWHNDYNKHVFNRSKDFITKQQILCENVYNTGAFNVWRHLRTRIVREQWHDSPGYPIKKSFYDRGLLACCIAMRKLVDITGVPIKKLRKHVKLLKEVGWIIIDNTKTNKQQNVYILGEWAEKKNEEGETKHFEKLYENEIKDGKRISPILKQNKYEKMPDLTKLTDDIFEEEMKKIYGNLPNKIAITSSS